ncbi:hypothetical protein LINPERPRIM_LOCUS19266 [Linum perenne]
MHTSVLACGMVFEMDRSLSTVSPINATQAWLCRDRLSAVMRRRSFGCGGGASAAAELLQKRRGSFRCGGGASAAAEVLRLRRRCFGYSGGASDVAELRRRCWI